MVENHKTVLLLDKVLLSPMPSAARGVEVFNLHLVRELSRMGHRVTVPCHELWVDTIMECGEHVETVVATFSGKPIVTGLIAALKLRGRKFDVLHLGNVANGLIPAVKLIFSFGIVDRCVLMSHREPSVRFVKSLLGYRCTVLAVNGVIAGHYKKAGYNDVHVYFGLPDADQYVPCEEKKQGEYLDFCIVGYLDNAWKGADTAIDAFRGLPEDAASKMRLHLISYEHPPSFDEKNIIPYSWMPLDEIPALLQTMDVMIVPSRDEVVMRETFCLAAVQGMLTGLPLLVSSLPVLIEKLDKGGGIVFNSTSELTDAMLRMYEDGEARARMAKEARDIALERYVWRTDEFVKLFLLPEDCAEDVSI